MIIAWAQPGRAMGLLVVVSDVSAQNNFSLYDAVLGTQTSVVFSRGAVQQPSLLSHYNTLPGVTAVESASELTASFLSTVDLLVVTHNFSEPLTYSASEISAVGDFIAGGGATMLIAEFNTIYWDPNIYNDFLIGIGSEIRYQDTRTSALEIIAPQNTPLTAGLDDFYSSAYNGLTGGIAGYTGLGGTVVAYEGSVIPEPSAALLIATGLAVLTHRRRGTSNLR